MNNITFRTQLEAGAKGDKGDQGVNFVVPTGGILAIEGESIPEGYEETDEPSGGGGSAAYSGEDTPSDNFGENGDIYFQILDKFLMSYATSHIWENVSITKQSDGSYTIVTSGKGVSEAEYVSYAITNLTIGKEYTISFDAQMNAEASFYNEGRTYGVIFADNATDYNASLGASGGAWDAINQYQSFYRDTNSHSYECTFTATATTMYFIIGYADVTDGTDDTLTISNINMDIYNEIKSIWTKKEGTWVKYNETIVLPEEMFQPIIYSLEEREVGVWIDNKPLYQKTYNISQTILETNGTVISSISVSGLKLINGLGVDQTNFQATPIAVYSVNNNLKAAPPIRFLVDSITIWYTKTTDTAGSGNYNSLGVPMVHYSTEEQIIGTWEDENGIDKPLYQKSYNLANPINGIFDTINNIEDVIKISGTFKRVSTGVWYDLDGRTESTSFNQYYVRCQINDFGNVTLAYDGYTQSDIIKVKCTIQYTKITD